MRYFILCFILTAALVVEELLRTLPYVGYLSPNLALLFLMVYAMKGDGEKYWAICFLAGLLKGSLSSEPSGFYILTYIALTWLILRIRGLLYVRNISTQFVLIIFAGCLMEVIALLFLAAGCLPETGVGTIARPLCSSISAAFLMPLAVRLYDQYRFLRILIER